MRVLRVIPTLDAARGGPSVAARATSRALAKAGATVVQVATVARADAGSGHGPPWESDGVTYRLFPRTLPGSFHYSRPLGRFLRASITEFDVIHVEALFQYPTIPACRRARHAGVPYVLAPLGSLNAWSIAHRAWKKAPYLRLVERAHLIHAAALHANSEAEAEALARLGFGNKVRLIPLGVEIPAPSAIVRSPGTPLRVLFLSRLHPVKGLPLLLDAMTGVLSAGVSISLTIAGTGDAAYERTLRDRVLRTGLGSVVRFVGHVEGEAKAALFAGADIFVLPSYQESFGLAVAEAMAHRVPVVITDRVGIERDVREWGAGAVVPPEAAAIKNAIEALARDPGLRAEMGDRGLRLVASRYTWDNTAQQLLALYEEVLKRSRPATWVPTTTVLA